MSVEKVYSVIALLVSVRKMITVLK